MKYNFYVNEICKNIKHNCSQCLLRQRCLGHYKTEKEKIKEINEYAYEHYQNNLNLYSRINKTNIK